MPVLHLASLAKGMRGLTPARGACLAEAGAVCLEDQGHGLMSSLVVEGSFGLDLVLVREAVDDQMRASHDDDDVATEEGACGVSILAVSYLEKLEVLRRSRKGTGFDYALSPQGSFLYRDCVRLEVTGIRRGGRTEIARRVRERRSRFAKFGDQGMPAAIIAVIEFSRPTACLVRL